MRRGDGFVAIEWVASVALLLLPIVVLVATLPTWAERRHTATVAAREAARALVSEWPSASAADGIRVAREVAADHDVDASDLIVRVPSVSGAGGGYVRVEVQISMPAIAVMSMRAGAWHYTAIEMRRIDDYRSR